MTKLIIVIRASKWTKKQHNKRVGGSVPTDSNNVGNNKGSADGAVIQTNVHYSENC